MATKTQAKPKSSKSKVNPRKKILEHFQDYLLTHGKEPASIYAFCKEIKIDEEEFYQHFANFGQVSTAFWVELFKVNKDRLENTPEYKEFTVREKLLSFYYSFFENLKAHRSYALLTLKTKLFSLNRETKDMEELKKEFKTWIKQLMAEGKSTEEIAGRSKLSDQYDSLYWYQFLFLMDFWRKDNSTNFERTDEAIEKTVNLSFDLIEKNALDSAFDFGKFLFQNFK